MSKTSKISGYYKLSIEERRELLAAWGSAEDVAALTGETELPIEVADKMIENVIGTFSLPMAVALNFVVNDREVLIPMVVEEPSIVAGASFMAKLARAGGGFRVTSTPPEMVGQIQILDLSPEEMAVAKEKIEANKHSLLDKLTGLHKTIQSMGGGARDLEVRTIDESPIGPFLVVHLAYDVRDAMGANAVNTACETLAPDLEDLTGGRVHLRILTNLTDRRMVRAECTIPVNSLAFDEFTGEQVRDGIIEAWAFAAADPYRAATHNKGIMNGIDPVLIATGNDWRAVEAGAHAYAARSGRYTSMTEWGKDSDGNLVGVLEIPLSVGIVGGATKVHPGAAAALKMMEIESANDLAEIIGAVGLAQNLAAIRALATEGIQKGHMRLHSRKRKAGSQENSI